MSKRKRAANPTAIELARVYDPPAADNCYRVLVDRLWPRGVKKANLALDAWWKELAPSAELRRWFGHDPTRWDLFCERYFAELDAHHKVVSQLLATAGEKPLLLLYAARDEQHNNGVALKQYLERRGADSQS